MEVTDVIQWQLEEPRRSTLIPSISVASTNDLIMGITGGADAAASA